MNASQIDKIEIIMNNYTFEQQREIFVEECAEAIQAVQKLKRSNTYAEPLKNFVEEVADVCIMAEQMKKFLGEKHVDSVITEKLDRQLNRIKEESE